MKSIRPAVIAALLILTPLTERLVAQSNSLTLSANQPSTNHYQQVSTTNCVIKTNLFENPIVRVVNGVAYHSKKSPVWENVTGTIESKRDRVIIVQRYFNRSKTYYPSHGGGGTGSYIGGLGPLPETERWRENGKTIAITNLPDYARLADGEDIDTDLMRVAVHEVDGRSLELWDRGTMLSTNIMTTNRVITKVKP